MNKLIYTIALVIIAITSSNAQEPDKRKLEGKEGRQKIEGRKLEGKGRLEGRQRFKRNDTLTVEQRAEKAATTMQKRLSLTDEQKQKVQKIELDRIKKNQEWRKQDEKAMKSKMEERKAFMTSSKEKIEKILTEEQRKTLASARENFKEKIKDNRGKRPGRLGDRTPAPPPTKN